MNNDHANASAAPAGCPSTTSLASSGLSMGGKYFQIVGWVLIVLSVPLCLVLVGFFILPFGIGFVWWGKKVSRDADRLARGISDGISSLGSTSNGRD